MHCELSINQMYLDFGSQSEINRHLDSLVDLAGRRAFEYQRRPYALLRYFSIHRESESR